MLNVRKMFLCSIIKIVCIEAATAKKVDNDALEKLNMKPVAGGKGLELCPGRYAGRWG